jgi:RNA polymerase sigma-70 factor (ECF subfamily)
MAHARDGEIEPGRLPQDVAAAARRGRAGDRQAIAELIRRYQGRIARFVIAETGEAYHYEDLCQTIFVKMVLGLPRLHSCDRFEPWLYQIARNVCRDHMRQRRGWRRLFQPYEPAHDAVAAPPPAPSGNDEERLARGMERLPASQRRLLQLSMDGKTSYAELARLTNSSIAGVKSCLHRARENLRGILMVEELE